MGARIPPDTRRRQLIAAAGKLLSLHGIEHVQITEIAEQTGVSRPLVYRLFPTRQALLRAVLEDFTEFLGERFREALVRGGAASVEALTTAFVEACCDAIEQKGSGPWLLLEPRSADPELCSMGRTVFVELLDPWQQQLGMFLGVPANRAFYVLWIIVAAGRATLAGWIDGTVERECAVTDATRVVTALLSTFGSRARERASTFAGASEPQGGVAAKGKASKRR